MNLLLHPIGYLFVLSCLAAISTVAQEPDTSAAKSESTANRRETNADLAAIRAESKAFVAAFNQRDAKAVAEFWTEQGEYTDETGRDYRGRAAIEEGYAQYFAQNPGAIMRISIESLRLITDSMAIEDGRAIVEPPPTGAPGIGKYSAVHVKVDGKWRMASVRDTWEATPSAYENVADLEWLIGDWIAEDHGSKTESSCQWIAGKSFVERKYTTTHANGASVSGVQIIGWDPQIDQVRSWNFSADGGNAMGLWTPTEQGWSAEIEGTTGDGTTTKAVNTLKKLDENAYVWQSIDRMLGEENFPDTDEIVIRRKPKTEAKK